MPALIGGQGRTPTTYPASSSSSSQQVNKTVAPHIVLGVAPNASLEEIRKAYRSLVLVAHPDKGGSPDRFQQIRKAWESLRLRRGGVKAKVPRVKAKVAPKRCGSPADQKNEARKTRAHQLSAVRLSSLSSNAAAAAAAGKLSKVLGPSLKIGRVAPKASSEVAAACRFPNEIDQRNTKVASKRNSESICKDASEGNIIVDGDMDEIRGQEHIRKHLATMRALPRAERKTWLAGLEVEVRASLLQHLKRMTAKTSNDHGAQTGQVESKQVERSTCSQEKRKRDSSAGVEQRQNRRRLEAKSISCPVVQKAPTLGRVESSAQSSSSSSDLKDAQCAVQSKDLCLEALERLEVQIGALERDQRRAFIQALPGAVRVALEKHMLEKRASKST